MDPKLRFPISLLFVTAVVGAALAAILANLITFRSSTTPPPAAVSHAGTLQGAIVFDPPRPDEAPADLREAVVYGQRLMTETKKYLPDHVGNALACTNCHFDAGRSRDGISLVGVAATYPRYRSRTKYATDLVSRTNECFERSMNGTRLDPASKEMQAFIAYYQWIARGLPIYGEIPWLGLKQVEVGRAADEKAGQATYVRKCSTCHGVDGAGTRLAPALWGKASFNDGAGMSQVKNLAAFGRANMPKNAPDLTAEEALDVAAYVIKQPRPHFGAKRA